jgi:hypothetical protein
MTFKIIGTPRGNRRLADREANRMTTIIPTKAPFHQAVGRLL